MEKDLFLPEAASVTGFLVIGSPQGLLAVWVVLVNLAPHKFCGEVSEGMLIAVDIPDEDDCKVIFAHEDCPVGQRVS